MEILKPLVCTLIVGAILAPNGLAKPASVTPTSDQKGTAAVSQGKAKATASRSSSTTKPARVRSKTRITEAEALKIVASRPEVRAWKIAVANAAKAGRGVTANIEIDREESGAYVVHVYEIVPDDAETSHTATFNWYYVNERTGAVRKEF